MNVPVLRIYTSKYLNLSNTNFANLKRSMYKYELQKLLKCFEGNK